VKVEHILHSKGADVYAVARSTSVRDAIDVLGEKNIGAVLVKDERGGWSAYSPSATSSADCRMTAPAYLRDRSPIA